MTNIHIKIDKGHLFFPVQQSRSRLFSRETFSIPKLRSKKLVGSDLVTVNNKQFIHSLNDVSLFLEPGDRLGLVGHNGAGKTTLLKALSGIYPLHSGSLSTKGQIQTFLSQGYGLNPEMTAIDYLELQCVLRNYDKVTTKQFIEKVVEFIEMDDFVFIPIRTYSTGMLARLLAAAAIFCPGDIFLIDEGIGAGDASFSAKFNIALDHFFKKAKILVLASHSEDLIRHICNKVVVMAKGKIVFSGEVDDGFDFYREYSS